MDMSTNNATKKRVKHTTQRWFSVGRHLGFAADLVALLLLFAIIILSTVNRRPTEVNYRITIPFLYP